MEILCAMQMKDSEILEVNKHILDDEVLKDISDTEEEIFKYQRKINERKDFISNLKYLLSLGNNDKKE